MVRDKKYIEQIQDPRLMAIKNKQDQDDAAFAAWYENNKDK